MRELAGKKSIDFHPVGNFLPGGSGGIPGHGSP